MKLTPLCCSQSQKYPPFGLPLAVSHGPPKASVSRAIPSGSFKEFDSVKKKVPMQITHSMPPQKLEIIKSLETWAQKNLLTHLKPVEKCWQPNDYVPDSTSEDFYEQVKELRARSQDIPDDLFVILVGNMITEEALPTYQTMFNTIDGCRDETGTSLSPWAVWSRSWTAEENRHGDLLNRYLYLSGRVDMQQIEKTIQYLIQSGMDPGTENDPYRAFIYTSFQERATAICHGNTARIAKELGDSKLAQICGIITADEKRHESAYTKIVEKLFEVDPDYSVLRFADMMANKITMPAHLMTDGRDDNLFDHFSIIGQRIGVYTPRDYYSILEHLVEKWKVGKLTGLSDDGRKAQDYLCGLSARYRKLEEKAQSQAKKGNQSLTTTIAFSWIFNREIKL